jgi:GH43 family beta-xylosidase
MKFNSKIYLWSLLLAMLLSCSDKDPDPAPPPVIPPNSFTNPLLTSGPDPWIIQKDSFYYYTHTLGNRITVWSTKKVSELKNAPFQTIWSAPISGSNSKNVWAPELHYLNNKWYAYYTAGSSPDLATQRTFVLENVNTNPLAGTWVEKGQIADPNADFFAIDGTVLSYNGFNYFIWSGHASATDNTQRIYIARMTNPWTLETARVQISAPQFNWEMIGSPAVNEGPEILKNPLGKVFLIYSASGCWTDDYSLGMLTLQDGGDPLNPAHWTKSTSPVFVKKPSGAVYGPGHCSFFKSPDGTEDWIIYHANSTSGAGCGDFRSPRIQKFTWNSNGTPNFGEPVSTGAYIQKPSGE